MSDKTEHGYAMLLLGRLLEAHDLKMTPYEDWFVTGDSLPAIRCMWFRSESGQSGQLDVEMMVDEDIIITERAAGIGEGEHALQDAFYNFSQSSLPVLLAAFWGVIDTEGVTIETWEAGENSYTAYVGAFGFRGPNDMSEPIPANTLSTVVDAVKDSVLGAAYHWVTTFFGNPGTGEQVFSAELNNAAWPRGEAALQSVKWPRASAYYSVRQLIVLKKISA